MAASEIAARKEAIANGIADVAPDFVLHLPSSTLTSIVAHCQELLGDRAFPITREEEGVGIAAGMALAGKNAVMVIQDNGIGNALTALTTFPQAYHIPMLLIVSRRGGLNEYNSMIHTFCERVEDITAAAGLRYFVLDRRVPLDDWRSTVVQASEYARVTRRPVIVYCNLMGE